MKRNPLVYRVNSYLAVLIVTIFGAGASLIIIHIANAAPIFAAPAGFADELSAL
jgi:hypothetical protein